MKKELLIYLLIVILSAPVFHPDLLTDFGSRMEMMSDRGNYYHPFIFALVIYLSIALLRLIAAVLRKIIKRYTGRARKH